MFCVSCGFEINDEVTFCPSCGAQQTVGDMLPTDNQSSPPSISKFTNASSDDIVKFDDASNDELKTAVKSGHLIAQLVLGKRYQMGNGIEQDDEQAVRLFKSASKSGLLQAMASFGSMLESGRGVEKNPEEAVVWYRLGAEQGEAQCQRLLALCFQHAIGGLEADDSKIFYWYHQSAKQNNSNALVNLGWLHENGQGTEKNDTKAQELYLKAAELGNVTGMENVGLNYEAGRGVQKDLNIANEWYEKAVNAGSVKAMYWLGCNYEHGKGFQKNWDKAKAWYQKAAKKGHKESEFRALFRVMETGSCNPSKSYIKFHRTSGTILESQRSSETHVSSSGGGGYVYGQYGGQVEAPTIHSNVVTTDDFWIKTDAGDEDHCSFTNKGISLRSGQKASLFYSIVEGDEKGPYLSLVNHSDGKTYSLKDSQRTAVDMGLMCTPWTLIAFHSGFAEWSLPGLLVGLFSGLAIPVGVCGFIANRISEDLTVYGAGGAIIYIMIKWILFYNDKRSKGAMINTHVQAINKWALTGNTNYTPPSIRKKKLPKKVKYAVSAVLVTAALATMVIYLPKQISKFTAIVSPQISRFYTKPSSATVKQNMHVDINPYEGKWHGAFKVAKKPNQPAVDIDLEIAKGKIKLRFHTSSEEEKLTLYAVKRVKPKVVALSETEDKRLTRNTWWEISMNSTNELLFEGHRLNGDVVLSVNLQRQL